MKRVNLIHPIDPVYDKNSKVLILGSFPSPESRKQNFYYANPSNRFWKVMAEIFQEEIIDRKTFCLNHHIALWDVISSCSIIGASDASIEDVRINDINALIQNTHITTVFTTGKKASNLYKKYISCDLEHICLPSTSGANAAMKLNDLVLIYQQIERKLR